MWKRKRLKNNRFHIPGFMWIQALNKRVTVRLNFEERKFILKYFWKCENAVEVQRQFRREFQRDTVYNQCFRINFLSSKLSLSVILLFRA